MSLHDEDPIYINLYSEAIPVFTGSVIDEFDFENVFCKMMVNNGTYYLSMSPNDDSPLLLVYNLGDNKCTIYGNKKAILIRFGVWTAFGLLTINNNTLAIHSSVIEYNNLAYMFLGESGTGKSTHTRLWRECVEGAKLLNDDSPIIRVIDGITYVYGSPWSGKSN